MEALLSLLESYDKNELDAIFTFVEEFKRLRATGGVQKRKVGKSITPMLQKRLDATVPVGGETLEQRKARARVVYEEILETL
jgi:hypothetical protein